MAKQIKIKVGSLIIINNPTFFIRCGYPLDFETELNSNIELQIKTKEFLKSLFKQCPNNITYNKVLRAVVYQYLRSKGFGGSARTIHTIEYPMYRFKHAVVEKIRMVKTGLYYGSHSSYDSDGEHDYEPAGIMNQKTHRILRLNITANDIQEHRHLEIEANNCELIQQFDQVTLRKLDIET